jgi:hypothetical protein
MITGDNPATAAAVARNIGLPDGRPVTGAEIGRMSDAELDGTVRNTSVFARIEPLRKLIAPRLFSLGKWKPVGWLTSPGATRAKRSRDLSL